MDGLKYKINRKFLLSLLLLSSIITTISASVDIVQDYREKIQSIETSLDELQVSFTSSLDKALWEMDHQQVNLLLEGIKSAPLVTFVQIDKENKSIVSVGKRSENKISKKFILEKINNDNVYYLGKVEIEADLTPVIKSVRDRAFVVIGIYLLRAVMTSILILIILNQLILKDILGLTNYFGNLHGVEELKNFVSERRKIIFNANDEIDTLIEEVNIMQNNLQHEYHKKLETQKKLEKLNQELEIEIEKRVEEIRHKDRQLAIQDRYKTMNEIAGHVAHELNNPLAIVKGYLEIIDSKLDTGDTAIIHDYFNKAFKALERVTKVSKSLMNLVSLDSSHQQEDSTFGMLIDDTSLFLTTYLESLNIKYSYNIDPDVESRVVKSKVLGAQIIIAITKDLISKCVIESDTAYLTLNVNLIEDTVTFTMEGDGISLIEGNEQAFDFQTAMDKSMGLWFAHNTLQQLKATVHYYLEGNVLLKLEIPLIK